MSLTPQDLARAEAFGRLAARAGKPIGSCPYEANGDEDQRVLAARFIRAYVRAGGHVSVDYEDGTGTAGERRKPERPDQSERPAAGHQTAPPVRGRRDESSDTGRHPYGHLFDL